MSKTHAPGGTVETSTAVSEEQKNQEFILKVKALAKSREEIKHENLALKEKIKMLEGSSGNAKEALSVHAAVQEKLRRRIEELESQLVKVHQNKVAEKGELPEAAQALREEQTVMLQKHAQEKVDLEKKCAQLEVQRVGQLQEKIKLEEALAQAMQEQEDQKSQNTGLRSQLLKQELDYKELKNKYQQLEALSIELKGQNRVLEEQETVLSTEKSALEQNCAALEMELSQYMQEKSQMLDELARATRRKAQLEAKLLEYQSQLAKQSQNKQAIIEELAQEFKKSGEWMSHMAADKVQPLPESGEVPSNLENGLQNKQEQDRSSDVQALRKDLQEVVSALTTKMDSMEKMVYRTKRKKLR